MKQNKPLQLMIQDKSRLDQLLKNHMSRHSKIHSREVSVYTEYILENPKKVTNQALSVYRNIRPKYATMEIHCDSKIHESLFRQCYGGHLYER